MSWRRRVYKSRRIRVTAYMRPANIPRRLCSVNETRTPRHKYIMAYAVVAYTGMACVVMVCIVVPYIVMAGLVTAYIVMAYIVMAYIVVPYIVMACLATACIFMADSTRSSAKGAAGPAMTESPFLAGDNLYLQMSAGVVPHADERFSAITI